MRKIITILAALFTLQANAQNAKLVVKEVDNGGLVQGHTYRLYLNIFDPARNVHAVFGDAVNPMSIQTTTSFYQHPWGSYNAAPINEEIFEIDPTLAFDSWITVGYENSDGNTMWDLGMNFTNFNNGGSIVADNGAWFLLPNDEKCEVDGENLVLLAQFTSTGIVSGVLSIQGWYGANNNWQERNLFFTTDIAMTEIPSPLESVEELEGEASNVESLSNQLVGMEIYPNPNRGDFFNLRLNGIEKGKLMIDITDMYGNLVMKREGYSLNSFSNQFKFDNIPAAGVYTVNVTTADGKLYTEKLVIQ